MKVGMKSSLQLLLLMMAAGKKLLPPFKLDTVFEKQVKTAKMTVFPIFPVSVSEELEVQ